MLNDLLLLRLLCARSTAAGSAVCSKVSPDLQPLAGDPGEGAARWRETFTIAVDQMAQAGCLTREGPKKARLRLTDAGDQRARAAFDVPADYRPATTGWIHWRDRFAVPKAVGSEHPLSADQLRALMLLRFYLPEIPDHAADSLLAAVELLLTRKIATKATPPALRVAALRTWITNSTAGRESSPVPNANQATLPTDLPAFATLVRETARHCTTGRFGDNKVFLSHVWRELTAAGHAASGEEGVFKNRLILASAAGLLRLSRADLAGAHEAHDVNDSEIHYLGETFHFLRLD